MPRPQRFLMLLFLLLALLGLLGLLQLIPGPLSALALILAAALGGVVAFRSGAAPAEASSAAPAKSWAEREQVAMDVRLIRQREKAFYELSGSLSRSLDTERILIAVQNVGELVTQRARRESDKPLLSAAFLFHPEKSALYVANSRGLPRHDTEMTLPGQEGLLGLALKQAEPVFGGACRLDPELSYIGAFREARSALAVPLQAGYEYFGVLVFASHEENAFSEDYVDLLKAVGTQATIALQNAGLYDTLRLEKERIVEVDEEARKKLARDLHDGPTQVIAAIAMRINYVKRLVEKQNAEAGGELGKIEELARRTTKEIRHMLFTLRPLILENQGLVAALNQLAEKMQDMHSLRVLVEAQAGPEKWLDHHQQGVLFYIVEEAINNARKHAQSEHIWVRFYQKNGYIVTEIEDDGVGFDTSDVEAGRKRNSLGMVNLRERTEMLGGMLDIQSQLGKGTKISVMVEMKESNRPMNLEGGGSEGIPAMSAPVTPRNMPAAVNPLPETPPRPSQLKRLAAANQALNPKSDIPHAKRLSPSD